jgi:flagellar export protein FliJ
MKSLATLIKLQKTNVDEQRRLLARLVDRLDRIEKEIERHLMQMALEQATVQQDPSSALTYGAFLKKAIARTDQLERQKKAAQTAVDFARDRLAELFEEQKRYETAEAHRIEREKQEELRRERLFLDEVGSVRFARKKAQERSDSGG